MREQDSLKGLYRHGEDTRLLSMRHKVHLASWLRRWTAPIPPPCRTLTTRSSKIGQSRNDLLWDREPVGIYGCDGRIKKDSSPLLSRPLRQIVPARAVPVSRSSAEHPRDDVANIRREVAEGSRALGARRVGVAAIRRVSWLSCRTANQHQGSLISYEAMAGWSLCRHESCHSRKDDHRPSEPLFQLSFIEQ